MRRGYILMEALIGGALVGTVLLGLFAHIGDARADSTRQARQMTAEQLALREVEELRALPFASVATNARVAGVSPTGDSRTITAGNGRYTIRRRVVDATEQVRTSGPLTMTYKNVEVTVSFPDRGAATRSITTRTRIYRE